MRTRPGRPPPLAPRCARGLRNGHSVQAPAGNSDRAQVAQRRKSEGGSVPRSREVARHAPCPGCDGARRRSGKARAALACGPTAGPPPRPPVRPPRGPPRRWRHGRAASWRAAKTNSTGPPSRLGQRPVGDGHDGLPPPRPPVRPPRGPPRRWRHGRGHSAGRLDQRQAARRSCALLRSYLSKATLHPVLADDFEPVRPGRARRR